MIARALFVLAAALAVASRARAEARVVLHADPETAATCRLLAIELEGLDIASELVVHDGDATEPTTDPSRAAIVVCRRDPSRIEIFRADGGDLGTRAPDHVVVAPTSSAPGHAIEAIEASEWIRALLIELPEASVTTTPEAPAEAPPSPAATTPTPDEPPRTSIFVAVPYLYASRPLRAVGVAAGVSHRVLPWLALTARLTIEARPARTIDAPLPFRVRSDRLELGAEHARDVGRLTLRGGVHVGGARVAVAGLDGNDRERRTGARVVGVGMLRLACAYRVTSRFALGLEADAGFLFREVRAAQPERDATIGRYLGSIGVRAEVRP